MSDQNDQKENPIAVGPNAWLIEEMYRQFMENPDSVSESWRDFFADYVPSLTHQAPAPAASEKTITAPAAAPPAENGNFLPDTAQPVRGPAAIIVDNMEKSLSIPTATSTRIIPVKILEENRRIINEYQISTGAAKVSFTHMIAWAILEALRKFPAMTGSYASHDGKPYKILPDAIHFGLAVDIEKKDGSRSLMVPNIKGVQELDFQAFFNQYNEVLRKVRTNQIEPSDFEGTTVTLTNPGMIGTVHSIPRLMQQQGLIIATGAIQYPPEWKDADPHTIARLGISKIMMVTSTYDHRIIQGAESGMFLQYFDQLMQGEHDFFEKIFEGLKIPYKVARGIRDVNPIFDGGAGSNAETEKQARVLQLINIYRVRGHLIAHINPLSSERKTHPELDPERYGLTMWDFDREFITGGLGGRTRSTLREILDTLRDAYCRTIGIEYMHIQEPLQKEWIQKRVEGIPRGGWLDIEAKRHILRKLNDAEAFERFLHTKYIGHKRFSLEGSESLIPMLDTVFEEALYFGMEEVVIGMAHRGRLNVLANNLGKSYERIFREFDGDLDPASEQGSGDVKYHLGTTAEHKNADGKVLKLTLASNPSHLEAVNPVVEGMSRAKQDLLGDESRDKVLPVLIHGDAAFAGQGVVAETLNLSALQGYRTGGTIHVVVNNGIGFTTEAADARSSVYATDVAKMVQAPIFHVNGDDPEACVRVIELAVAFRQEFKKDVVVDMISYRRHGHNEGDEPSYTQPLMYKQIKDKRSVRKLYTETLIKRGDFSLEEAEASLDEYHQIMETAFKTTKDAGQREVQQPKGMPPELMAPVIETGIAKDVLNEIVAALSTTSDSFTVHPKLKRLLDGRKQAFENDAVDWALGEALAFGSLLLENIPIRLSGQDSRRGTFSQRHSVLVDFEDQSIYVPLNHIRDQQAEYIAYDSLLSEYAVLGFEYGYSVSRPEALVLWEAQFGDFVNGGQIIIDQFISSAEDKWNQKSRLVMLLPHGFEGQGPEHSSARLERFLTLCAEYNMRVTFPSNAAQYFHLLRRQMHLEEPKPLIVMTPKSLLRSDWAKSPVDAFSSGHFQVLLDDPEPPDEPKRVLLCSGKVAYDLLDYRKKHNISDTAIVRMEQLYPFPYQPLREILKKYPKAMDVRWVQEEPRNMGAWYFVLARMDVVLTKKHKLTYVSRFSSGSPASGSSRVHEVEQEYLVQQAFADK
ncbi:MAG: multifunctional oxoglutarate decarboxylase/oxoglutarate dehydrogenase thiamine pyrophosphate-binding subunit/dihydrolipoyllysine-residue succinyltransferase subunit [Deferribacteres bacterium]|nr:multifunctional oxoglutarate decarboxylase/oxoglutarate dehydrogenase thiamine pyrophosphate-binding subunit/dihydrolipoyllysine-residue succinyltransferase subunit [candidate division KSB1 bacterium]MCB9509509.1 multifunctional oxoglutarate decarboxylase/oxoglutarate dehydrogenase thiamine pyrophosphate-binding subunit/dihydrolipoyllysine-residue succinyltransferase subunit [Deferribacteres bacterium]